MQKIKVLYLTAELTPLVKVGGLADVSGALPAKLRALGIDIRIMLPYYEEIKKNIKIKPKKIIEKIIVRPDDKDSSVSVYQTKIKNTPLYLIENKHYLSCGGVYTNPQSARQPFQGIERFLFFNQAVLSVLNELKFSPDVIHANDWFFGIIPALIQTQFKISKIKTLLTINNLGYQGIWNPKEIFEFLKIDGQEHHLLKLRDKDANFNLMQQGVLGYDLINTVSPTYAQEIITPEYGAGLETCLKQRKKNLVGILNGLDQKLFSSATNPFIKKKFGLKTLNYKIQNKLYLQKSSQLKVNKDVPLIGSIGRLDWQKGAELIFAILPQLAKTNCQFILLGTGDKNYEKEIKQLAEKYSRWFKAFIKFDATLQYQIYAGVDMFVVPSKYEPCGLSQMIAMSNATIPIVRATGGLNDTVTDYQPPLTKSHTGFIFKNFTPDEFLNAVKRALDVYTHDKLTWNKLQTNCLRQDLSWDKSAQAYLKLYQQLLWPQN